MSWPVLAGFAAGAWGLKAAGWWGLSRVATTGPAARAVALLPAALIAALVAVQTFGPGDATATWTRAAGVAAGGAATWARLPLPAVIVVAAAVTAALRQVA